VVSDGDVAVLGSRGRPRPLRPTRGVVDAQDISLEETAFVAAVELNGPAAATGRRDAHIENVAAQEAVALWNAHVLAVGQRQQGPGPIVSRRRPRQYRPNPLARIRS